MRLPWIFSDQPEISADFNFSPGGQGTTNVELCLGGRFSKFGLPRGAARAPMLEIRCEFVSPGELISKVAELKGSVDLSDVLRDYGARFNRAAFSSVSPFIFKSEFSVALKPGDYNVIVSIQDKELSISSRRTLHVIVPDQRRLKPIGDLKFCLGVGESLDAQGRRKRVLDPNPWRQVAGSSKWDLIVAYDSYGSAAQPGLKRRHSIRRLRGDAGELWGESDTLPAKRAGQLFIAQPPAEILKTFERGVYVFEVAIWAAGRKAEPELASKTFEILP